MKGYKYLKYGLDGELEPKTIIRTEHISEYESFDGTKDYDYYIFENDNMFHRCNKDGKLGAKYQDRFLNYKVLNKEFELYSVLEEPQPTEEEIKEYTNKFLEVWEPISKQFGKLFDEIIRIKNDLGLNLEDFIKEEPQEHKIPEKINDILRVDDLIPPVDENMYKIWQQTIKNQNKINEILDYLEEIE